MSPVSFIKKFMKPLSFFPHLNLAVSNIIGLLIIYPFAKKYLPQSFALIFSIIHTTVNVVIYFLSRLINKAKSSTQL